MDDLIEALMIFKKYANSRNPCVCEHEQLYIVDINPESVSQEDIDRLDVLGFFVDPDTKQFTSFRFGSA